MSFNPLLCVSHAYIASGFQITFRAFCSIKLIFFRMWIYFFPRKKKRKIIFNTLFHDTNVRIFICKVEVQYVSHSNYAPWPTQLRRVFCNLTDQDLFDCRSNFLQKLGWLKFTSTVNRLGHKKTTLHFCAIGYQSTVVSNIEDSLKT